jgi:hypothetical protein
VSKLEKITAWSVLALLLLWGFATIYGVSADMERRSSSEDVKKQLADSLEISLESQRQRFLQSSEEHHRLKTDLKKNHEETSKQLKKIEGLVTKPQKAEEIERLICSARKSVKTLTEVSSTTESFRLALHSVRYWSREYNSLFKEEVSAPRASDGSQAVIDYYSARLPVLQQTLAMDSQE